MSKSILIALTVMLASAGVVEATAAPRARQRQAPAPAAADDGYFQQYVTGPGGQRIPLRDYPGSATVITRKMMNDFQANNLCDALRFAPGVIATGC